MKNIILIGGISILVLGGVFVWQYSSPKEEQTFCTQEALMCPDGSFVSRTGPQCQFSACGNTETSYIGTLRQNENGFQLITESPNSQSSEVEYVLPLEIKVSNVLGEFVGKRVQVFGMFRSSNIFIVDRLQEFFGNQADKTLGELKIKEVKVINGVRIQMNNVTQDSRCPIDVTCIRAGDITVNVTLKSNTDEETRNITSDQPPVSFDSYQISIVSAQPSPLSSEKISPDDYTVLFKVTENIGN